MNFSEKEVQFGWITGLQEPTSSASIASKALGGTDWFKSSFTANIHMAQSRMFIVWAEVLNGRPRGIPRNISFF